MKGRYKRRKKGLTFLLIFISSPLEIVSGEKKNRPIKTRYQLHFDFTKLLGRFQAM